MWGAVLLTWAPRTDVAGGFVPSGMVVASEFPLFDDLRRRLAHAFRVAQTSITDVAKRNTWVPEETDVAVVLTDPARAGTLAAAQGKCPPATCTYDASPSLTAHAESPWAPLPPALDLKPGLLFECLSIPHVVEVFAALLLERKVLLVSKRYTLLTLAGEALRSFLSPLSWSHVYAPVLPRSMLDLLMCPTPFLIGVHKSYAFKRDFPFTADVMVVDLDADEVRPGAGGLVTDETSAIEVAGLPFHVRQDLIERLDVALRPCTSGGADDVGDAGLVGGADADAAGRGNHCGAGTNLTADGVLNTVDGNRCVDRVTATGADRAADGTGGDLAGLDAVLLCRFGQ